MPIEGRVDGIVIEHDALVAWLEDQAGAPVEIIELRELHGDARGAAALKQFGYGRPIRVSYRVGDDEESAVLHYIKRNAFGRERDADRIAAAWLDFHAFNRLPRHVPALDILGVAERGDMRSLRWVDDVCVVTAYRPGRPYADDLLRLRDEGESQPLDVRRAEALAAFLADIHSTKHDDPWLWQRRLRDLLGDGEGIMGMTDSYPSDASYVTPSELQALEEAANRWRWRLKPLSHRLTQVHGDFHPFNVLFEEGTTFHLLDRSRGEWGEPADDVSCMTINYLFFSLQRSGRLAEPFRTLHDRFWEHYQSLRPDAELVSVIQPWFAWRALVLASPTWYPNISTDVRRKLLTFARNVMDTEWFEYQQINQYLTSD